MSLIRENEQISMQRSLVLFENSVNSEGTMKLYKKDLDNYRKHKPRYEMV